MGRKKRLNYRKFTGDSSPPSMPTQNQDSSVPSTSIAANSGNDRRSFTMSSAEFPPLGTPARVESSTRLLISPNTDVNVSSSVVPASDSNVDSTTASKTNRKKNKNTDVNATSCVVPVSDSNVDSTTASKTDVKKNEIFARKVLGMTVDELAVTEDPAVIAAMEASIPKRAGMKNRSIIHDQLED